jgi:hypothetical protein
MDSALRESAAVADDTGRRQRDRIAIEIAFLAQAPATHARFAPNRGVAPADECPEP